MPKFIWLDLLHKYILLFKVSNSQSFKKNVQNSITQGKKNGKNKQTNKLLTLIFLFIFLQSTEICEIKANPKNGGRRPFKTAKFWRSCCLAKCYVCQKIFHEGRDAIVTWLCIRSRDAQKHHLAKNVFQAKYRTPACIESFA